MKFSSEISVIIPYYNEIKTLPKTLEFFAAQTLLPREIIFVNSSSTDGSSALIDAWIEKNASRFSTQFRNIFENTNLPSSSKNVGIRHAQGMWLAFMDCGLLFEADWLEKQWDFVQSSDAAIVFGQAYFEGTTLIDRCCVAHTYGFRTLYSAGMTPASFVKRTVFDQTGLFLHRRSGYDATWRTEAKRLGIKTTVNPQITIRYNGVNFAETMSRAFSKSVLYAVPSVKLLHYRVPYFYVAIVVLALGSILLHPPLAFVFFLSYWILKGYGVPWRKSKNLNLLKEDWRTWLLLPVVALVMDAGRFWGILKGIYFYHFQNRGDNTKAINRGNE